MYGGFLGRWPSKPELRHYPALCSIIGQAGLALPFTPGKRRGSDGTASSAICWKGVRAQLRSTALNAF
jgi:hypothetical protein